MNIKNKYKDNYILLAGLRQYVENGVVLAWVNFYRDSVNNYPEFDVIKNRGEILKNNASFSSSNFLVAFVEEDFPNIDDNIPENIIEIAMSIIEIQEDKETAALTKQFLIEYAVCIAKASKEDWLSFIGIKDAISNSEAKFIKRLEKLFSLE